ncbi:MAG TPA: hypothetical protein VJ732_09370 [Bryobacteraceae bacterium]|nr:hypothetical protein [Bryobacteraceae bacterium]
MRSSSVAFLIAALLIPPAFAANCDRACLKGVLDQYLNAVIHHDPAAVPLTPGYRQTENAVVRRPGQGIWQTAKALGKVQRRYFDPITQNVAYFGTLEETSGDAAVVTVRLKVAGGKVAEAEWYLARKGDPGIGVGAGAQANRAFWDPEYLAAHPPAERVVPKSERVSREDLIAITNSYFDSLSAHDGRVMIAHPGCVRLENGVLTTQRDAPANLPPGAAGVYQGKTDCMNEAAMRNIYAVVARRFPIVDEEAGTVLGLGVFLRKPGVAMRRNQFSEWFVIDKRKLSAIYSSMFYPDQDALVPNWPPYDGHWPVPLAPR